LKEILGLAIAERDKFGAAIASSYDKIDGGIDPLIKVPDGSVISLSALQYDKLSHRVTKAYWDYIRARSDAN